MKRLILCLLALALLLCAGSALGETCWITGTQSPEHRVKLRSKPSGTVIGQYYADTEAEVLGTSGKWSHVLIGGREGWMMSEFLTSEDDGRHFTTLGCIRWPDADGCIPLRDEKGAEILRVPAGNVDVLGTVGSDTLHIAVKDGEDRVYGFVDSDQVSWTDNFARAVVTAPDPGTAINVRREPSRNSRKSPEDARLYPGTEVYLLFDSHTAGDGWHRVRADSVSGYMMDKYLDFSTGGVPAFRPAPATLRRESVGVGGSDPGVGHIYAGDPLFVLGVTGKASWPLYYCRGWTWLSEEEYGPFICYVEANEVEYSGGSASTRGSLRCESPILYPTGKGGALEPIVLEATEFSRAIDGTLPAGTRLRVIRGVDAQLKPVSPEEGYLTADTAYIVANVELDAGWSTEAYIPIENVRYDPLLMLPEEWTNG